MVPGLIVHRWIDTPRSAPFTPDERLRAGLPSLPYAWQCNLADDSLSWSRGVFDLFGIAPGERLDRREVLDMYVGESREIVERLRARAVAECRSFTMEAQIAPASGGTRWMRLSADVVCRDGRPTTLYGIKQDITAEWAGRSRYRD